MQPLGKRLPDILIGLLIVVLAVGLGTLLLTQRNRAAAPAPSSAPTASIPAAPGNSSPSGATSVTQPVQTPNQPAVTSPPVVQPETNPAPQESTPHAGGQTTAPTAPPADTQPTTPVTTPNTESPPANSAQGSTAENQPGQTVTTQPPATQPPATANEPAVTAPVQPPTTPKIDTSKPPVVTTHSPVQKIPSTPETPVNTAPTQAAPPRSSGAVATSENRVPLRRDYRISLGVFNSRAEVERQTAAVAALGYTVYPIDLGDRVVAQVGPFADASTAQQASQDIARAYRGATVLAPRGSSAPAQATTPPSTSQGAASSGPASSGAATSKSSAADSPSSSAPSSAPASNTTNLDWQAPASSAATTDSSNSANSDKASGLAPAATQQPTAQQPTTQKPAPSGPVYLQVGAFDRPESAQAMVSQLKDLGYEPSVQAPEGKKVTVLIGPFRGDALLRTETRLDSNGFDHFRVH